MLPALDEFVTTLRVRFRRPEGPAALERSLTGLLTAIGTKHCDTRAVAVPDTSAQRLQELLTNMPWDEEDLNRQRVHKMIAEATGGHGVLIFDDTGFAKQGKHAVGVARQYSGTLGKVGNCQVAVRADVAVRPKRQEAPPRQRADQVLAALPRCPWRTIRWRQGAKGWWRKKFVAVRAWRVTAEGELHVGWLLGERAARGQPEEQKYDWSNLPTSARLEVLVDYAHRRHAIEQFHEEAKGELGWDHYQGRLWPGFHRHAVTVMLAYSFLVWLGLRQRRRVRRRGQPRDPLSPSARPVAADAPRRAPRRRPMAPPPSSVLVGDHRSVHRTLLTTELTK